MKKLVINNETELLCLQTILEEYPTMLPEGEKLSAITANVIKELLQRTETVLQINSKIGEINKK